MPVQIGAPVHSFSDPTGLLSDCHRRIEMFLGALQSAAPFLAESPNVETRASLAMASHYFREAAPKHNADEEESLSPCYGRPPIRERKLSSTSWLLSR